MRLRTHNHKANADLRKNPHWKDNNPRGQQRGHNRGSQGKDSGQGRNRPGPAKTHLRRKGTRGRTHCG